MDKYIIEGGNPLKGEVSVSGAKNAALPLLTVSLMTEEDVYFDNVPNLMDIRTMVSLLEQLGKKVEWTGKNSLVIREVDSAPYEAPYDIVRKMRASIVVLGPLLARRGQAKISFPGGCAIGPRPVDLHIRGMEALGTQLTTQHGYIWAKADELVGKKINLRGTHGPSVLATENVMMAAAMAKGTTVIESAAEEPEVTDLANCLNKMGAKISGAGTSMITIEGVNRLSGTRHSVIPDRIEAGTFISAAAITGGEIHLKNLCLEHIEMTVQKFSEAGTVFEILSDTELIVKASEIQAVEMITKPYPFYATDMQPQLMALLTLADGISVIRETVFPERFTHAAELNRLGADVRVDQDTAVVHGVKGLSGASVMASDLRAGAGLVCACLAARGHSEVLRIYHIDRGYENFEEKLTALGAKIKRAKQD